MQNVILERQFDPALRPEDFRAIAMATVDCLPLYRVEWRESLLARDGNRLLCRFVSPDTESVRMVTRAVEARQKVAWSGSLHDSGREHEANVVVERRFEEAADFEALQALEDAGAWCLEQYQVTFLRTFFSADRKRMICLYRAPDAESVRRAQHQAKMPVERVWACQLFTTASFAG